MSTNDELAIKAGTSDQINEDEAVVPNKDNIASDAIYSPQNLLLFRDLERTQGIDTTSSLAGTDPPFPPPLTIDNSPGIQSLETVQSEQPDSKPAAEKITTIFTEAYDKKKVQTLIKKLEDNDFNTRITARDTLAKMGPKVLPDLEKAIKESDDLEVQLRAGEAIEYIKTNALREDTAKYLAQANRSPERTIRLLSLAGISVGREKVVLFDDAGNLRTTGPRMLIGNPPGGLTADDRKGFEEMIKQGDLLAAENRLTEIQKHVQEHGEWDDYVKLAVLGWSKDGRIFYARALSASNDPKDTQKGIELLSEYLDRNKDFKPNESFMQLAAQLRADKDKAFIKAFSRAGGDVHKLSDIVDSIVNERLYRANSLANFDDPTHHHKGIGLLIEHLQANKDYKPDEFFTWIAARLGAHNNKEFLKTFKGTGGNVAELNGWVNKLVSTRQNRAQNLSVSSDPVDHEKGVELLTELLQKYPKDFKQDKLFMILAARLKAQNNEPFLKAFRNAGGNIDELKKAADELKKKGKQ